MTARESFKLEELAERAGMSVRTVRYYLQRGLLEPPPFRGKDTAYGPEHLLRLRVIRRLQDRFLPLDAIQAELAGRSADELERLASGSLPEAGGAPPVFLGARVREDVQPAVVPTGRPHERGVRVRLAPGIELWVSDEASDGDRRLALRTADRFKAERGKED